MTIAPSSVRYIKLSLANAWAEECLRDGIIRFGFTANEERFALCQSRNWEELRHSFEREGSSGITKYINETRCLFEDTGNTLWITFVGELLYWCMLVPTKTVESYSAQGQHRSESSW